MPKYHFYTNCVNWPRHDVHVEGGLCNLIADRVEITRRTLLEHVDRNDLESLQDDLGYERHGGLHMASDWHVEYFRSKLHGKRVYGFRHSAIEYVFRKGE